MTKTIKLKEIVVAAMISAILGVVFTGIDSIYQPIQAALGPLGGDIIGGVYYLSALIPAFIIRKPGAGLMGSLFTGVMNLLLGSPYGINVIVAAILQGIGVEAILAISKYNKYSFINMALAGVLAAALVSTRDYFIFGFDLYAGMIPVMLVARAISSMILGGFLAMAIGNGLKTTGVLSGFNISSKKAA